MAFWKRNVEASIPAITADDEKMARLKRYQEANEVYTADLPDPLIVENNIDDNVKINPARAMIDTTVDFLFGNEIKFELSPEQQDQYGDQQVIEPGTPKDLPPDWLKELNRCWKANRKQSLLQQMGKCGAINGDVFIKFSPNDAGLENEYPRMILLDPANVDVVCDENDYNKVLEYSIEYVVEDRETGKRKARIQKITANRTEDPFSDRYNTTSWSIQNYEHEMQYEIGGVWYPGDKEMLPVGPETVWPYKWAPIEHCQNLELPNQFWGLADLDNSSIELIKSLQRAASSINKIVRIHGSPRMYAKGVRPEQADEIDVSADNIITMPGGPEQDLRILNALSSVDSHIKFTESLREDLYESMQIPAIALGKQSTASTAMGGLTLSILYAPVLQKTRMKRISYGDMIDRINMKLLVLMGHVDPSQYDGLVTVWPEAMPGSKFLDRQTIQQDQQMGLSQYTTMKRLGYDPQEEAKRRIEEQVNELRAIGDIQQEFGDSQYRNKFNVGGGIKGGGSEFTVSGGGNSDGPGGNNNPAGKGNPGGSMGAVGNGTPKNKANPTTSKSRGGGKS